MVSPPVHSPLPAHSFSHRRAKLEEKNANICCLWLEFILWFASSIFHHFAAPIYGLLVWLSPSPF